MSEKNLKKGTWIETREYPGSHLQPIMSTVMALLALAVFLLFSTGDIATSAAFFLLFALLTFSVAIFPQYLEFSGMSRDLVARGMAKAQRQRGIKSVMPIVALLSVLLVLPIVMIIIAPPFLFWGSITGIVAGFASFQLVFTLYVRRWSWSRGLKVSRYSMVSRNEVGKRVVTEYGLKAVKI